VKILLVLALPSEPGSMPTYAAPWVGVAVGLWCVQRVNLSLRAGAVRARPSFDPGRQPDGRVGTDRACS